MSKVPWQLRVRLGRREDTGDPSRGDGGTSSVPDLNDTDRRAGELVQSPEAEHPSSALGFDGSIGSQGSTGRGSPAGSVDCHAAEREGTCVVLRRYPLRAQGRCCSPGPLGSRLLRSPESISTFPLTSAWAVPLPLPAALVSEATPSCVAVPGVPFPNLCWVPLLQGSLWLIEAKGN